MPASTTMLGAATGATRADVFSTNAQNRRRRQAPSAKREW